MYKEPRAFVTSAKFLNLWVKKMDVRVLQLAPGTDEMTPRIL